MSVFCESLLHNSTNRSHGVDHVIHLDTHKAVAGGLSFLLTLPFVLFHFNFFPIGSTSAVLTGAFLMVVTLTVGQRELYDVVGGAENLRTIFLLLGMMLLAQYFERELLIEKLMAKFLRPRVSFPKYLLGVTSVDFLVAAVFTNDVACVVLTPLILRHWQNAKRPRAELGTLLLGIATSANIGSATTIFGNPQMALIASKTSEHEFRLSQLDMRRCIVYLWLPATVCYVVNFCFLLIHYKIRTKYPREGRATTTADHVTNIAVLNEVSSRNVTNVAVLDMNEISSTKKDSVDNVADGTGCFFNATGLVPIGAAIVVICADALINKRVSLAIMKRVDWSVLMMFFGIFVWLYGLNSTQIPRLVWQKAGLGNGGLVNGSLTNYVVFFCFIVFGSNVFSNVPLTIIVLELLAPCVDQLSMVLYLGWLATVAGNLTLFGSVANLIVAQKSFTTIQYRFGFLEYLEFGLITTFVLSILGMLIIFGLLLVV